MKIKKADFEMRNVIRKSYTNNYFNEDDFKGYVSVISIEESTNQARLDISNMEAVVSGYKWVEFFSDNSNSVMTAIYDENNNILQWYFDIVSSIVIKNNIPYFEDLYLDIRLFPNGEMKLVDENELKDALNTGDITKEQFDNAYHEAKRLMNILTKKMDKLVNFTNKYFKKVI